MHLGQARGGSCICTRRPEPRRQRHEKEENSLRIINTHTPIKQRSSPCAENVPHQGPAHHACGLSPRLLYTKFCAQPRTGARQSSTHFANFQLSDSKFSAEQLRRTSYNLRLCCIACAERSLCCHMGDKVETPSEHPANVNDVDEWYSQKYAQLCAEAHSKHISNKTLSGKGVPGAAECTALVGCPST